MNRLIVTALASAALCIPSIALADHPQVSPSLMMQEFDSEEDCEEALAESRNAQRKNGSYEGRERGQFNKSFNAQFHCMETVNAEGETVFMVHHMEDAD